MIVVRSYPQGPRCWIAGQRVHHGATGAVLAAAALATGRRARLAMLTAGLALCLHDRHDARVWFKRESVPAGD